MNGIEEVITQFKAQQIVKDAADYFGVSIENLLSPKRHKPLVYARCVITYILYSLEGFTYQEIGDLLQRCHATIIHQERVATSWMRNPRFNQRGAKAIETISRKYGYNED